jgi:predicted nucleotidyltransferase
VPTVTVTLPEVEIPEESGNVEALAMVAEIKADQAIEEIKTLETETEIITDEIIEEIKEIESWTEATQQAIQSLTISQSTLIQQLTQATALIESLAQIIKPLTQQQLSSVDEEDPQNQPQEPTPEKIATSEPDAKIKTQAKAEASLKSQRLWN